MEIVFSQSQVRTWMKILVASSVLGLSALVRISCGPVPFTLQTCALFIIALRLPPKSAFLSVMAYLAYHTAVHPLWIVGPTAGYLIAFPFAAYLVAQCAQKISPFLAVFLGQGVIYALGVSWLSSFVGLSSAWWQGVVLFLIPDLCKAIASVLFIRSEKVFYKNFLT